MAIVRGTESGRRVYTWELKLPVAYYVFFVDASNVFEVSERPDQHIQFGVQYPSFRPFVKASDDAIRRTHSPLFNFFADAAKRSRGPFDYLVFVGSFFEDDSDVEARVTITIHDAVLAAEKVGSYREGNLKKCTRVQSDYAGLTAFRDIEPSNPSKYCFVHGTSYFARDPERDSFVEIQCGDKSWGCGLDTLFEGWSIHITLPKSRMTEWREIYEGTLKFLADHTVHIDPYSPHGAAIDAS